ncbi:hypothetical protein LCGC14_0749200 [marine sediment metagenome]|uniref:Uncharacterized protein n=1 Tax=marine sediment metagenome TaxID=412755 RepID=A0A0F9Q4I0_9ZZZZ
MTKRCRHIFETKEGYPDDVICRKCETIWTLTDYKDWVQSALMTLPLVIRQLVFARQNA